MALQGDNVDPLVLFQGGIPFDGPVDVEYFERIPNESTARKALEFMMSLRNEISLRQRHSEEDVGRMWLATFRGCLAHGVPIPENLRGYAQRLGVVFPE
jgi:hypothetical protein